MSGSATASVLLLIVHENVNYVTHQWVMPLRRHWLSIVSVICKPYFYKGIGGYRRISQSICYQRGGQCENSFF